MDSSYFTAVILLIIISSILTPIILKALYEKDPKEPSGKQDVAEAHSLVEIPE